MYGEIFIVVVILAAIIGIALVIFGGKKRKLTESKKAYYRGKLWELKKLQPSNRIIRYDSILHMILRDLGYEGTLGEQLKKKPHIIGNLLNDVWRLHKSRNKIAHDISMPKEHVLENDATEYEEILRKILS